LEFAWKTSPALNWETAALPGRAWSRARSRGLVAPRTLLSYGVAGFSTDAWVVPPFAPAHTVRASTFSIPCENGPHAAFGGMGAVDDLRFRPPDQAVRTYWLNHSMVRDQACVAASLL